MAKIIAIANQKGGVGKTTTCVNLTAALHSMGYRVLLVDSDPQGNASSGMGVPKSRRPNTYDLLVNGAAPEDCVVSTPYGDLIPTGKELAAASVELINRDNREFVLKTALQQLYTDYDYIFIDCPPSLGFLTINSLTAVDSVLIPIQCEFYALEGVSQLMSTIDIVRTNLNPDLEIEGVILSMFDGRTNLSVQVVEEVKKYFREKVYATVIPRNVRLAEAPSHGMPVIQYDPRSTGAHAYMEFADEFLESEGAK